MSWLDNPRPTNIVAIWIVLLILNLALLAGAVWVVVWVLRTMGVIA